MKSIRRKRRTKRQRLRRPINVAASVITTFSLYCGIASIFASINGEFRKGAYLILAAMVLDTLDGAVARLTKSVSDFGKELDSLSDVVSFGVAPAVLIYTAYLREPHISEFIGDATAAMVAIIFVICGALRLARYNVYQSTRRDSFVGLPIPAAAGTVASFALFTQYFNLNVTFWVMGPITVALALLMVSTVRYPRERLKKFIMAPRHAFRFLVLVVVGIAVFHYASQHSPAIILMPLAVSYVLFGILDEMYLRVRRQRGGQHAPADQPETPPGHEIPAPK